MPTGRCKAVAEKHGRSIIYSASGRGTTEDPCPLDKILSAFRSVGYEYTIEESTVTAAQKWNKAALVWGYSKTKEPLEKLAIILDLFSSDVVTEPIGNTDVSGSFKEPIPQDFSNQEITVEKLLEFYKAHNDWELTSKAIWATDAQTESLQQLIEPEQRRKQLMSVIYAGSASTKRGSCFVVEMVCDEKAIFRRRFYLPFRSETNFLVPTFLLDLSLVKVPIDSCTYKNGKRFSIPGNVLGAFREDSREAIESSKNYCMTADLEKVEDWG
jgi:hypothetical protein